MQQDFLSFPTESPAKSSALSPLLPGGGDGAADVVLWLRCGLCKRQFARALRLPALPPGRPLGESSRYRFLWRPPFAEPGPESAAKVDLHGWCAGLYPARRNGAGGFLYVRARNRLGWYAAPEPPAPGEYDDDPAARRAFRLLGCRPKPGFCRAAALFFGWVEEYENWIEQTCGPDYRRRSHGRAPLPWLPPAEAREWLGRYRQEIASFAA